MCVRIAPALLVLALALVACGGDDSGGDEARLKAVATTTQVADLLRHVGGERVQVHQILPPEADPHTYEPRPSDAVSLAEASVVFKSGGDLDSWLDELLDSAGGDADVISLIDHVRTIPGDDEADPHWWQDPRNAILAVAAIRDALIDADPDGRATYERNAAGYAKRLERLDSDIATCMRQVPPGRRKLVTSHDALAYFARRYDIEVVGALIPSLSTEGQPSAREIDDLVEQIHDEGVNAIFPEAQVSEKLEQAVSSEAGASVGQALWTDSLGARGSTGHSYLAAMAFNARAMVDGMTSGDVVCHAGP